MGFGTYSETQTCFKNIRLTFVTLKNGKTLSMCDLHTVPFPKKIIFLIQVFEGVILTVLTSSNILTDLVILQIKYIPVILVVICFIENSLYSFLTN